MTMQSVRLYAMLHAIYDRRILSFVPQNRQLRNQMVQRRVDSRDYGKKRLNI